MTELPTPGREGTDSPRKSGRFRFDGGSYIYGPVHAIVTCRTCGWETASYKNAQALAARHAKAHGHYVVGEIGLLIEYDYRHVGPAVRP